MRKLYENFHIFHIQKRIVSAETVSGTTVLQNGFRLSHFVMDDPVLHNEAIANGTVTIAHGRSRPSAGGTFFLN